MPTTRVTELNLTNGYKLSGAKFMYAQRWTTNGASLVPPNHESTIYDITAIMADTVSIEQDDPETNDIASEFSDTPLDTNTTLGKYNFSATCIDFQNTIMKEFLGWKEVSLSTTGTASPAIAAQNAYEDMYAEIVIGFSNAIVVLPKVHLNSKAVFSSLKSGAAEAQIAGTCLTAYVKFSGYNKSAATPVALLQCGDLATARQAACDVAITAS